MTTHKKKNLLCSIIFIVLSLSIFHSQAFAEEQTADTSSEQTTDTKTNTVAGKKAVTNILPKTSRAIGKFNVAIYQMFIHPVGTAYGKVVPTVVDKKINDVLDWSYGPYYMVNDILMGDMNKLANNTGSFLINGTVGLLGVFNVSSMIDIHQSQDNLLGTLHTWGLQDHIYVQLPFVGPQTELTMFSLLTSSFLKPTTWLAPSSTIRPGDTVVEHVIYTRNILEYGEVTVNISHGLNMLQTIPGEKDILLRDAWLSMHNLYIDGESAYDIDLDDDDTDDSFGESDF